TRCGRSAVLRRSDRAIIPKTLRLVQSNTGGLLARPGAIHDGPTPFPAQDRRLGSDKATATLSDKTTPHTVGDRPGQPAKQERHRIGGDARTLWRFHLIRRCELTRLHDLLDAVSPCSTYPRVGDTGFEPVTSSV